jgi:oligopeptide transport system substrate-binding protein
VAVEKSPTYWDADRVQIEEIHFLPIENAKTEETAFFGGRLHHTNTVPSDKIPTLKERYPDLLRIEPYLGTYFYRFNTTRPPLDDPRVREALALSIDRELIIERITQGGQIPAYGFTPDGMSGYQTPQPLSYDPERARELLAEAGFEGGEGFPTKEILINTSEAHRKIAEAIQAMWRTELGIDVGIYNQEWKVYLDSQSSLDYDISRAGWIGDYIHPITFLELFTSGNGNNDTGWENAEYDRLIRTAQRAGDEETRMKLMLEAEEILLAELPVLPIYWYTRVYLQDPRLKNWNPKLLDNRPYKYLYFEDDSMDVAAATE